MKSPIDLSIEKVKKMIARNDNDLKSLLEFLGDLKEEEKSEMVNAWVDGNTQGWEMKSDWREDGEEYYENRFK